MNQSNQKNDASNASERGIPQVGGKKKYNRWTTILMTGAAVVMLLAFLAKGGMDRLKHRGDEKNEPKATRGLPNLARSAFDTSSTLPPPPADKTVEPKSGPAAAKPTDDLLERRKRAPVLAFGGRAGTGGGRPANPSAGIAETGDNSGSLGQSLRATRMASSRAYQLKDPNLTLTQGSFIDCTLITAINSTLPGMTSCVLSRDVYSTNGKVLLVERGSKFVGQYQAGQLRQGMRRLFVLWTRIETPKGVLVNLDSPMTDSLGRSGSDGRVNNHFWERFGAAMLVSVVDDVLQAAQQKQSQGDNSISFSNSNRAGQDSAAVIVQNTVNIPPTLEKDQGSRIGVFVARDVYFGDVYTLRPSANLP